MAKKSSRTSQALRDVLFDEIEDLRSGDGDPQRAVAVANLARQIINVAKVELDFHRQMIEAAEQGNPVNLGQMQLGTQPAASAEKNATEH